MRAGEVPDYEKLEGYFRALAYSTRLELLHQLRMPKTVLDIRLTPRQVRAGQSATRPASRQAIEEHLAQLLDIGVVVTQESAESRGRKEFVANGAKLYQIMEEFRLVGAIMPSAPGGRDLTVGVPGAAPRCLRSPRRRRRRSEAASISEPMCSRSRRACPAATKRRRIVSRVPHWLQR